MKKLLLSFLLAGFLCFPAYADVSSPDQDNLVGAWSLNESDVDGSTLKDKSGNGNDGTSANTPVYAKDQAGVPNQAMVFNGTTDVVNCGSDTSIANIFDSGGTISVWINPSSDGEGSQARIFNKWYGWLLRVGDESGSKVKIIFAQDFDTNYAA